MANAMIGDDRLAVLSDALQDAIAGRKVEAAVFTTFSFDPGFFELHILPSLFNCAFHQVDKIKQIQLEDALRSTRAVAVYYDGGGLSNEATPAHLDFARIAIRHTTGCFHPKLVCILVTEKISDGWGDAFGPSQPSTLIVGTLSANLTRSGWWENLEVGHLEEIRALDQEGATCPFKADLLDLLQRLRKFGGREDDHTALNLIESFVQDRVTTEEGNTQVPNGGRPTRLFHGQASLPSWLEQAGLARFGGNLEVISPYFDKDDPKVLRDLIDVIKPHETRVFLPRDHLGNALATPSFLDSVDKSARWSDLPAKVLQQGGSALSTEATTQRRVHAKVYRFWNSGGKEFVLAGSPNLTSPGHSAANSGNFETAFLVDMSDPSGCRRPWLEPLSGPAPAPSDETEAETSEATPISIALHLRYDWRRHSFEYRLDDPPSGAVDIHKVAGLRICSIPTPQQGPWIPLPKAASDIMEELLKSTSFVELQHLNGTWRVLVREEEMHHRPSLLRDLSPDEILRYWSLLSEDQRAEFIERRLGDVEEPESLQVSPERLANVTTVFDRVAGVFHAFERQYRRLKAAIANEELRDAKATLFGTKYDSLPVLLDTVSSSDDQDPVMAYLTFLCARQLVQRLQVDHADFFKICSDDRRHLDRSLKRLNALRDALLANDASRQPFLDWYEEMFQNVIVPEKGDSRP